jgi:hypothetical protein
VKNIVRFLILALVLPGCKKAKESICENPVCTKEIRYVAIQVRGSYNVPVALDSFVSVLVSQNKVLIRSSSFQDVGLTNMRGEGEYVIASDNNIVNETPASGSDIRFTGYKNGEKVAEKIFRVGHDCCHVKMISTDTTIVIP